MASLIATADGNWLTAGTWGVAEAGTGAIQATRSASTNTTTSYVYSSAFTCTNADVMDGLLLHCKRLNTTGTVTVTLSEDNGSTATREVTLNASDLPADPAWVFFKFASTLTADGGTDYKVGVKASSANNAAFYRDGTAGNWSRLVRLTATAAPNTGDNLYIAKEWTAAATGTARAVTMNAIAGSIVDHGTLDIGQGGTLTYGATAATAYYLRLSGDLNVWDGGTLNMGTVATPMPGDATAKLNFDCGTNVVYGLLVQNGGAFVAQGATKTVSTFLAADAAANATSLTTADSTSWADNDEIAIASTTRTNTQCEKGALNGAASGTGLTVDGFGGAAGGVQYAHSGTAPTRAEVINLTRNVQLFGASASLQAYIYLAATSAVDWDYAEFYWLGSNTGSKRGIDVLTTTGSFSAQYCSLHDFAVSGSTGINVTGSAASNITYSNNVSFNISNNHVSVAATSGTWTISGNIAMLTTAGHIFTMSDVGGTFADNTAVGGGGSGSGFLANEAATLNWSGLTSHSNISYGLFVNANISGDIELGSLWRNNNYGILLNTTTTSLTIRDGSLFGNTTANIWIIGNAHQLALTLTGLNLHGDTTFATGLGLSITAIMTDLIIESCDFGTASGILANHTSDIEFAASGTPWVAAYVRNTKLATGISALTTNARVGSFIRMQKYGQTAADHRTFTRFGNIQTDATIYRTAAPSERLTPSSASSKLESGPKRKTVNSGGTATFSVYVRKSEVADGAAYNGSNQPRLVLRKNVAAGIAADAVLDTATAASDGAFELLTGTSDAVTDDAVLEAFVDCEGTAGFVNVDDYS